MNFLEQLAKIPLPRLIVSTLLLLLVLAAVEQMPWIQSVAEHVFNMEAPK